MMGVWFAVVEVEEGVDTDTAAVVVGMMGESVLFLFMGAGRVGVMGCCGDDCRNDGEAPGLSQIADMFPCRIDASESVP